MEQLGDASIKVDNFLERIGPYFLMKENGTKVLPQFTTSLTIFNEFSGSSEIQKKETGDMMVVLLYNPLPWYPFLARPLHPPLYMHKKLGKSRN